MKLKVAFIATTDSKGTPQIGDCIVITFGERFADDGERKACIVIDGGYSSTKVALRNYLQNENIEIIDLMLATHIDNDHISGLHSFLENYVKETNEFELRNYWGPAPKTFEPISLTEFLSYIPDTDDLGIEELSFISQSVKKNEELYSTIKDVLPGDRIFHPAVHSRDYIPKIFNRIEIEILAPDEQIPDDKIKGQRWAEITLANTLASDLEIDLTDEELKNSVNAASLENNRTANNQSIVIKLTPLDDNDQKIKNCGFLFTGDAERESWENMMIQWDERLKSELLKVSHHGSRTGTTEDVLRVVKPRYCVICAGKNRHGLPDEDVLKMIDKGNMRIFCTGRNPKGGEGPCTTDEVLKECPRWDDVNGVHIKDAIIFEVDTDSATMTYRCSCCGLSWKNI